MMSGDRRSVPVSLPPEVVAELDRLVEEGIYNSRSEALRYGARLVLREQRLARFHDLTDERAKRAVEERIARKRVE